MLAGKCCGWLEIVCGLPKPSPKQRKLHHRASIESYQRPHMLSYCTTLAHVASLAHCGFAFRSYSRPIPQRLAFMASQKPLYYTLDFKESLEPPNLKDTLSYEHSELENAPPFHTCVRRFGGVAVCALADNNIALLVLDLFE
jgi:hypothetical protein